MRKAGKYLRDTAGEPPRPHRPANLHERAERPAAQAANLHERAERPAGLTIVGEAGPELVAAATDQAPPAEASAPEPDTDDTADTDTPRGKRRRGQ